MEIRQDTDPDKAFRINAANLQHISIAYASASILQAKNCRHGDDPCGNCRRMSEHLNYFSVALAVVASAAGENKAAELYDVITRFAAENLPGFPAELATRGLYESDAQFPETIEEWK